MGEGRITAKREIWFVFLQCGHQTLCEQLPAHLAVALAFPCETHMRTQGPPHQEARSAPLPDAGCILIIDCLSFPYHLPSNKRPHTSTVSWGPITPAGIPLGQSTLKTAIVWISFRHSLENKKPSHKFLQLNSKNEISSKVDDFLALPSDVDTTKLLSDNSRWKSGSIFLDPQMVGDKFIVFPRLPTFSSPASYENRPICLCILVPSSHKIVNAICKFTSNLSGGSLCHSCFLLEKRNLFSLPPSKRTGKHYSTLIAQISVKDIPF